MSKLLANIKLAIIVSGIILFCVSCNTTHHKMDIATWNVQRFPDFVGNSVNRIGDVNKKIADSILASGVDVLALNEVFSEESQNFFRTALAEEYPYQVTYIDGSGPRTYVYSTDFARALARATTIEYFSIGNPPSTIPWVRIDDTFEYPLSGLPIITQDSGLMFFSKYPFEAMSTLVDNIPTDDDLKATANGSPWRGVAFKTFTYCEGSLGTGQGDCSAKKGAGMVKIRHPGANDSRNDDIIYNILFTHLEAGADEVGLATIIRDMQIDTQSATIDSLINDVVRSSDDNQVNIIMGDLNINGAVNAERTEWREKFATSGRLLADEYIDTWEMQSGIMINDEEKDPGYTSGFIAGGGTRIDYINLESEVNITALNSGLCVQHVYIDKDMFASEEGEGLSDHRPLRARINRDAPLCKPSIARPIIDSDYFEDSNVAVIEGNNIEIRFPYSSQWFLVTQPGTYSVTVANNETGDGPTTEIYAASDLSSPVLPYRGLEREFEAPFMSGNDIQRVSGSTYVVNSGPFYIKAFYPPVETDSGAIAQIGSYSLVLKKHSGSSIEDAIFLTPNQPYEGTYRAGLVGGSSNRYFRIDTDGPISNQAQGLEFTAHATDAVPRTIAIGLLNSDLTVREGLSPTGNILRSDSEDNFSTFYLVAQPAVEALEEFEWQVEWSTNLTMMVFKPKASFPHSWLKVLNETAGTNVGEDDDIRINFFADDLQVFESNDRPNLGNFNIKLIGAKSGTNKRIDLSIPCSVGFINTLRVELEEADVNANDLIVGLVNPLDPSVNYERDNTILEGGSAEYRLTYELRRGTQGTDYGIAKSAANGAFVIGEPCF